MRCPRQLLTLAAFAVAAWACSGEEGGGTQSTDAGSDSPDSPFPPTGDDVDGDGIPNADEDLNRNGRWDPGTRETDWQNADTDGDGFWDGDEDTDGDAEVGPGETDPRLADTDGDGIDDGDEAQHATDPTLADSDGDGLPDGAELTAGTDPTRADSDGDGLPDGDEDIDGDGQVDPGETDPRSTDTDSDGTPDAEENLAQACARSAEPPTRTYADREGDWTLVAPASFSDATLYDIPASDDLVRQAAWFADGETDLHGFLVSRSPDPDVENGLQQIESELIRIARDLGVVDRRDQQVYTWDEAWGATSDFVLTSPVEMQTSTVRDRLVARMLFLPDESPGGAPEASGASGLAWRVRLSAHFRSDDRVILIGTVVEDSAWSDEARMRSNDVTGLSTLSQWGDDTRRTCTDLPLYAEFFDTDFLWIVDDSISMVDDRETVASTASVFFDTLLSSLLAFRVAVSSSDMRTNLWLDVSPGFSSDMADFVSQMHAPPGGDLEFGLDTAVNLIDQGDSVFAAPHQAWRSGAKRILIFMSDEDDQGVKIDAANGDDACDGRSNPTFEGCARFESALTVLRDAGVTAYAITGDAPDGCTSSGGPGNAEEAGFAYLRIALETGGSTASICASDLGAAVNDIVRAAIGAGTLYTLPDGPIATTIRVMRNGEPVPRSGVNGWDYDAATNSLLFFGTGRPAIGDAVAVGYRYFLDLTADRSGYIPPR